MGTVGNNSFDDIVVGTTAEVSKNLSGSGRIPPPFSPANLLHRKGNWRVCEAFCFGMREAWR